MTNDTDIKAILSVIIDKLNRIEANVAQAKPAPIDAAIDALQIGAEEIEARRLKLLAENARWFASNGKPRGK